MKTSIRLTPSSPSAVSIAPEENAAVNRLPDLALCRRLGWITTPAPAPQPAPAPSRAAQRAAQRAQYLAQGLTAQGLPRKNRRHRLTSTEYTRLRRARLKASQSANP